jgi:bacteriocin-like protein
MEERRSVDFCELTSEELDHVVGGDACGNATVQRTLIAKSQVLHAAQAQFEQ